MTSSSSALPAWANYSPQVNPGSTSLKEEEFHLRQNAYRHAAHKISSAYHSTLDENILKKLTLPLLDFFHRFQFDCNRDNCNDEQHQQRQQQRHKQQKESVVPATSFIKEIQNILASSTSQIKYHPTILPIAILNTPSSSMQDRTQIISQLMRQLQPPPSSIPTKPSSKNKRCQPKKLHPAICHLTFPSHATYRDHGNCIFSILKQCIAQEPHPYSFAYLLSKRNAKSLLGGYTQRLKAYASQTRSYDSIVVVVEDMGNGGQVERVLDTLRLLREEGVPLCVVLGCTAMGRERAVQNLDWLKGDMGMGMFVRDFFLVGKEGKEEQMNLKSVKEFWEKLHASTGGFRFLLGQKLVEDIMKDYHLYHGSMAKIVMQLKEVLAHAFCKRGSFLAMAHDPAFLEAYGTNVAWFCADSIARKNIFGPSNVNFDDSGDLLSHLHEFNQEMKYDFTIGNLIGRMKENLEKDAGDCSVASPGIWNGHQNSSMMNMGQYINKSVEYSMLLENIYDKVRTAPLKDLIIVLSQWYSAARMPTTIEGAPGKTKDLSSFLHADSTRPRISSKSEESGTRILPDESADQNDQISKLSDFLRDSICLLAALLEQDDTNQDILHDFRESLVEELHGFLWDQKTSDSPFAQFFTFGVAENDDPAHYLPSLTVEPRRSMASAISMPESLDGDCSFDLSVAFHIMHGRVILVNTWFEQFTEKVLCYEEEDVATEEILLRFAFAVYQLMHCGFIVRSRRKDDAFEKAAMIWASSN